MERHQGTRATGLRLFNTLTRKKEPLAAQGRLVSFYFCGPTVYDFVHLGNLRAYVFADILRRYLGYAGYRVTMVMNITDVDDKTIRNSRKEGMPLSAFTKRFERAFFEDVGTLRIQPASVYPRATEHIAEMAAITNQLLVRGAAYIGEDGSVYYSIGKFPGYGRLSGLDVHALKSGTRVRQDEYTKEQVQDFALWKAYTPEDGDVFWLEAFGGRQIKGRPGWHIECSAMSSKYLGMPITLHGGGVDLIFPHHENEIAQSEGASGGTFVQHWVHCDHLIVDGKKMSKSLGNFFTLRDILAKGYSPVAVRFLLLSTHYRSQLNFTFAELEAAQKTVDNFNAFIDKVKSAQAHARAKHNETVTLAVGDARIAFENHMNDDLAISEALAAIFSLFRTVNSEIDEKRADAASLQDCLDFLAAANAILDIAEDSVPLTREEAELVRYRDELRIKKRFDEADKIRADLRGRGVHVEDTPYGPRWRKKSGS